MNTNDTHNLNFLFNGDDIIWAIKKPDDTKLPDDVYTSVKDIKVDLQKDIINESTEISIESSLLKDQKRFTIVKTNVLELRVAKRLASLLWSRCITGADVYSKDLSSFIDNDLIAIKDDDESIVSIDAANLFRRLWINKGHNFDSDTLQRLVKFMM